MGIEKSHKKNIVDENSEVIVESEEKKTSKPTKRVLSFDVYFQLLMKRNSKIRAHHKAPMKKYAENNELDEATEEDFDKIFKRY